MESWQLSPVGVLGCVCVSFYTQNRCMMGWAATISVEEEGTRRTSALYRGRRAQRYQRRPASWRRWGPVPFRVSSGLHGETTLSPTVGADTADGSAAESDAASMDRVRESPSTVAVDLDRSCVQVAECPQGEARGDSHC